MYAVSSRATPLTVTFPLVQQATLSPPTPMTRLIRSFSLSEGNRPTNTKTSLRPRSTALPELDDLAPLRVAEVGGELVDQHPVADQQRVLHGVGRDEERLHQERLDQQRQ